jgi:hypothetical protein
MMAYDRRKGTLGVESYGSERDESGQRRTTRYRLGPEQARILRRVFGLNGEVGCGSNFGSMCERLAAAREPEAKGAGRRGPDTVHCKASHPRWDVRQMLPQERYLNDLGYRAAAERQAVLTAWRTLARMSLTASACRDVVVLYALYGDMPPGLPARGLWGTGTDEDYRRVCRLTDAYGPGLEDFEARTNGKRVAPLARQLVLAQVGRECEGLIVRASRSYEAQAVQLGTA